MDVLGRSLRCLNSAEASKCGPLSQLPWAKRARASQYRETSAHIWLGPPAELIAFLQRWLDCLSAE